MSPTDPAADEFGTNPTTDADVSAETTSAVTSAAPDAPAAGTDRAASETAPDADSDPATDDAGAAEAAEAAEADVPAPDRSLDLLAEPDAPSTGPLEVPAPDTEPIEVIPLEPGHDPDVPWSLRVPPVSATNSAQRSLVTHRDAGRLHLPDDLIANLAHSVVKPAALASARPIAHRVKFGWLWLFDNLRVFSPLVDVAIANERWVAECVYDADPAATGQALAVPLPSSHPEHAVLVYEGDPQALLTAADHNFRLVLENNRQDVGRRLVEQPITLVPTIIRDAGGTRVMHEFQALDGNSRTSVALSQITVPREWLPSRLRDVAPYRAAAPGSELPLLPSLLANLDTSERRGLVRRAAKRAEDRLAQPVRTTRRDRAERDAAATTLNCLTVPARVIVGWSDDEAGVHHNSRFFSSVRALLLQLNVEGEPIKQGARNVFSAEQAVVTMGQQGLLAEDETTALVGRVGTADAMERLGLDPTMPDLRAALVLQVMSRKDAASIAAMRAAVPDKRNPNVSKAQLHLSDRSKLALELALRSFSATIGSDTQIRNATQTVCMWQDLVAQPWTVSNVATDDDVDDLAALARTQRESGGPAVRLLGVLGMVALVMSGHLHAPGGSAEDLVGGVAIDRGPVGSIVEGLLKYEWGITLLADAIKRFRAAHKAALAARAAAVAAGEDPPAGPPAVALRWVDPGTGDLVDDADERVTPGLYNAQLRLAVKRGASAPVTIPAGSVVEGAWTDFASSVTATYGKLVHYVRVRNEHKVTGRKSWAEGESAVNHLGMTLDLVQRLLEPKPLTDLQLEGLQSEGLDLSTFTRDATSGSGAADGGDVA